MDESTALHTAARRYCQERFSEWVQVYEDLQRKENWQVQNLFKPGWDYSDEAYKTFPRYRVAKNTQIEIERLAVEWLIQVFHSLHPECIELTYRGPYSTPDLRGSWETS